MPTLRIALLLLVVLAGCRPDEPAPAPSPTATASAGLTSLSEALPSPVPKTVLPSMPPKIAGRFVFYEDFEQKAERWQITGESRGVGWRLLKASTCGGLYTMLLGHAENKPFKDVASESFLALKAPIDLTKTKSPQLQYDLKGLTYPPELIIIRAEVKPENGDWQPLGATANARYPLVVTFTADLAPYVGQTIGLRFRGTVVPNSKPNKGIYLDDIHVIAPNTP